MSWALHWQPDPNRHIARLPSNLTIDGHTCLKVYTTEFAVVYQGYGVNGTYAVYEINRVNYGEQLGNLILNTGDLVSAMDAAGIQTAA